MSQSHRPTRAPVCSNAIARFAATVDLPTPPLPLAMAITCRTPGIRAVTVAAPAPPGGAWISISTLLLWIPSMVPKARSSSFLIVAGTFGSLVANASCTLTSPLSMWIDFTNPNEMISRVKPGYFTDFNAFFTCSSEIDIFHRNRPASDVNQGLRQRREFQASGRSFQRVEDNASHLVTVNWTAPAFEEGRCVRAFVRLRRRARNNSIARVTCWPTRKLSLFPLDRKWESPGWIHQTRHSRL